MPKGIDLKHNMAKLQTTPRGPETTGDCENYALEAGKGGGKAMDPGNPGKGAGDSMSNIPTSGKNLMRNGGAKSHGRKGY